MLEKITHYAVPECCRAPQPATSKDSELVPKAWESRYTQLDVQDIHLLRQDTTGAYTPQGACTDGTYLYRALVSEDNQPTKLQKLELHSGNIVKESLTTSYGHANDMTYKDGKLFIAHSSSTNIVYEVDATTFELVATHELPLTIWGIAYDPVSKLFVFGGVGSAFFSVYYQDFDFMYRIKPANAFTGMVRQGIHADSNYIYVALDNAYGANIENSKGSRIMVYTWNGMFIKSINVPVPEIEWAFENGGYLFIGTYEGRDANNVKSGKIYKIPFDLYPEQTVLTGRPTDVSGGINNLQRLPEGTNVRLFNGAISNAGGIFQLKSSTVGLEVDENGPFRYLRFRFKGANQQVFDWYPQNNGVVALREVDITDASEDSNIRVRECRLSFNKDTQVFTITSNKADGFLWDASEGKMVVTKYNDNSEIELITINQVWGVV